MDERAALVGWSLALPQAPRAVKRLLEACSGSASEAWRLSEVQLRAIEGVPPSVVAKILSAQPTVEADAARALKHATQHSAAIVTRCDADYPERLKTIHDPPPALYVRGTLSPHDTLALAIVGSRYPTPYGAEVAERFGRELAEQGVTVISGMARGIDGAAHHGALAGGGRTIAVLGSGLARLYPPEHRELAEIIAASGAVISEFPLDAGPDKAHFPQRNRVISGLSLGVLVVEAAEKSGALITATAAAEQGRDVFAIPGKIHSPTSCGTHALLKDGAKLVTGVADILEELRLTPARSSSIPARGSAHSARLSPQEQSLLAHLSDEPLHLDDLATASGMSLALLSSILVPLELQGVIRQWPGQRYTLHSQ